MQGREWDAQTYHRVSTPQQAWGAAVLDRVEVPEGSVALDAGCGSGRLTGALRERLPRGRVIGIDASSEMVSTARMHLAEWVARGDMAFLQADVLALPLAAGSLDLVFSTATFHWVLDHDALFAELSRVLRRGGRLVAQCGGGANIERVHGFAIEAMRDPLLAPHFGGWRDPWLYAGADETAARLRTSGFTDVRTRVFPAPTVLADAASYREFIATVILRTFLAALPEDPLREHMLDLVVARGATTDPPYLLDYWRLDIDATRR